MRSRREGQKLEREGNVDIPRYVVGRRSVVSRGVPARFMQRSQRRDAGNNGITGNNQMKGFV